jgi:hypothetical protein
METEAKQFSKKEYINYLADILEEERNLGIWTHYTESELDKIQQEYNNLTNGTTNGSR